MRKSVLTAIRAVLTAAALVGAVFMTAGCAAGNDGPWQIVGRIELGKSDVDASNSIGFLDEKTGFAYYGNDVLKSTDGGNAWVKSGHSPNRCVQAFEVIDANTVVTDCTCSPAQISEDSGKTWRELSITRAQVLSFRGQDTAWSGFGIECINLNAGKATTVELPDGFSKAIALAVVSADRACALDTAGEVWLAGVTPGSWKQTAFALPKDDYLLESFLIALRFADEQNGLLVVWNKKLGEWTGFRTRDGGATWAAETIVKAKPGPCYISPDISFVTIKAEADNTLYITRARPSRPDA
jgi:photosystem II stability/assembly factor-like uncharacterized protein